MRLRIPAWHAAFDPCQWGSPQASLKSTEGEGGNMSFSEETRPTPFEKGPECVEMYHMTTSRAAKQLFLNQLIQSEMNGIHDSLNEYEINIYDK